MTGRGRDLEEAGRIWDLATNVLPPEEAEVFRRHRAQMVEALAGLLSGRPSIWPASRTGAGKRALLNELLGRHGATFQVEDLKPGEILYITKDRKVLRSSE